LEQKEILHRYLIIGNTTLDKVLQVLNHLTMEGLTKVKDSQFPLKGETNLYKLMNRSDPLTSVFLNEKVNLNQLKKGLEEQGIPFAFKETPEGTNLYFRIKDEVLAKNGLEKMIASIKESPKTILKKPQSMTFDEKVAYVKQSKAYKGNILNQVTRSKGRNV